MWPAKDRTIGASRSQRRLGYFDDCLPLFEAPRKGVSDHGFARLAGRHQGRLFDLQAVPDALSYRKLPCLWLMVTLTEPMAVSATVDVMVRPSGTEIFSHFSSLSHRVALPGGFPRDAVLHTDDPQALPPVDILEEQGRLFADQRVKELVIAPKGLRIVWLAEEADRTRYLLFRDSELGDRPLVHTVVRPLLDRLTALALQLADLAAQAGR